MGFGGRSGLGWRRLRAQAWKEAPRSFAVVLDGDRQGRKAIVFLQPCQPVRLGGRRQKQQ
jgi:hypothetical protein